MKKSIVLLSIFLSAVSCIYPYEPDKVSSVDDVLVFDGDLVIGTKCIIEISMLMPLKADQSNTVNPFALIYGSGKMTVEDSEGKVYPGVPRASGYFEVDLSSASEDLQYRLTYSFNPASIVNTWNLVDLTADQLAIHTYQSPWLTVQKAPGIDGIRYEVDEKNLVFDASLTGKDESSKYYRWGFEETWEFHADFNPEYYYDRLTGKYGTYPEGYTSPVYYCWTSAVSRESSLFSTEGLTENRVKREPFHTVSRTSRRLQEMYRLDLVAKGISRDGYMFHKTLKQNSNSTGDLFSANPSELRGNITRLENEGELVLGFVEAVTVTRAHIYVGNMYYRGSTPWYNVFIPDTSEDGMPLDMWYDSGYRPAATPPDSMPGFYWTQHRCIDCTLAGGRKTKPEGWPTSHE